MPGTKGDEFLDQISSKYAGIIKILVTGYAEREVIEKIKSNPNVHGLLYKPWSSFALKDLVNQIKK